MMKLFNFGDNDISHCNDISYKSSNLLTLYFYVTREFHRKDESPYNDDPNYGRVFGEDDEDDYDGNIEDPEYRNDDTLHDHHVVRRSASPPPRVIIRSSGEEMYS